MLLNIDRARKIMEENEIDALIASSAENFHYASDFPCPYIHVIRTNLSFVVVPRDSKKEAVIVINAAEKQQAEHYTWIKNFKYFASEMYVDHKSGIEVSHSPLEALAGAISDSGLSSAKLGVELETLAVSNIEGIKDLFPKATIVDASGIWRNIRAVKTPLEIERLREAARVTDIGVQRFLNCIAEGVTELELKRQVQMAITEQGADIYPHHPAHITLGAGRNSGAATVGPTNYCIQKGDIVRIDLGGVYDGYVSDIARVGCVGEPAAEYLKLYNTLLEAQQETISAMKPGILISDLFKIGVEIVRRSGYPKYARGLIGHGVGLEVHDEPLISNDNHTIVEPNMVLALEIPYYIEGKAGFNIEDVCLITENGRDILSTTPRELHIAE